MVRRGAEVSVRSSWLWVGLAMAPGCLPHVGLDVLEPAEVAFPAEVRKLAVIDRSGAANVGEGLLGALEGAVTGEGLGADTEGRQATIGSMVTVLGGSPRFEVVVPPKDADQQDASLFDKVLPHRTVKRLANLWEVDALVSLEAFDSDSSVATAKVDDDDEPWTANRATTVVTAWRVYDGDEEALLDDLRAHTSEQTWDASGATEQAARDGLPSQMDSVVTCATLAGEAYARRIAPTYVWVTRAYYGGGDERLTQAKRAVKRGDWAAAEELWADIRKGSDDELDGKASFNLAVAAEVRGELAEAVKLADRADQKLGKGRTRRYAAELRDRQRRAAIVEEQMRPPEEPAPPEESPAAAPGRVKSRPRP